ncbi:HypC/HybG/HupF family hydrogenase formation chaperone [Maledivibacter halophilus]|uniref:Hydrogenase maturation protein HypC n=1 Tax=Maledivibacter halophilus TaxID=36842 RepID=A0A1T5LAG0_9FIRM|nr:HypC/HybG/HupF family hydrogenase formation chaperone [Maledivibacter halophilus]SKC72649.1 Hydrogenase maturation protein HypC [Maledivibacter halophilus]
MRIDKGSDDMCIAVPAEVIKVYKDMALVDFGGVRTKVSTCLVGSLNIGDYVLIHVGCAIQKIDKVEAERTLKIFNEIVED